ncbi:hypothetical protein [Burkholderia pseudomallei]|uniref:hypothetical protein n=2 Tax=Burkholderia pseudomallei TaxID=28450 RepID=UPI000415BA1D|nr:hypothetical protein [Burkholderia pseudomallei]MBD2919300.1 hypothetical protein [Burkholderia pseudomallei]MBD2998401.1 hypothetical protein [Burkholderia pseudomallei]MBF3561569.1 hypothetical protein [Burkholderia pseudomallei]MDE3330324.1 hypothetical protein [Burkholderia pseudomallei]MDY7815333.1 hypothetical protein [Burkholderia pseudomallei]
MHQANRSGRHLTNRARPAGNHNPPGTAMLHIHANHEYNVRETLTWAKLQDAIERHDRNYFAGHCLDAIELMPSGAMQRIEPAADTSIEPFAASTHAYRR